MEYINEPDDTGFNPFLAGGEEDYEDPENDPEYFKMNKRIKKCGFILERLKFDENIKKQNDYDHSKIYVKFTLLNAKEPVHLNEEKSKERMREILESLCSNVSYNITRIQFGYDNLDGVYQVSYDNGKKPITQSRWMDHIEKYPEDHLSLMYLEWREENLAKENK